MRSPETVIEQSLFSAKPYKELILVARRSRATKIGVARP
jgi:hypothetical protein